MIERKWDDIACLMFVCVFVFAGLAFFAISGIIEYKLEKCRVEVEKIEKEIELEKLKRSDIRVIEEGEK